MIRTFTIFVNNHGKFDGNYLEARIVEYRHSPTSFYVTFHESKNPAIPKEIILNTRNGKLVLAKESPQIDVKILKSVIDEIKKYLQQHKV